MTDFDVQPFFDSKAGPQFAEANYDEDVGFETKLRGHTSADDIKGEVISAFLRLENYTDSAIAEHQDGDDSDIPSDITDFVVRSATLHKEFDKPTSTQIVKPLKESVGTGLKTALNSWYPGAPNSTQIGIAGAGSGVPGSPDLGTVIPNFINEQQWVHQNIADPIHIETVEYEFDALYEAALNNSTNRVAKALYEMWLTIPNGDPNPGIAALAAAGHGLPPKPPNDGNPYNRQNLVNLINGILSLDHAVCLSPNLVIPLVGRRIPGWILRVSAATLDICNICNVLHGAVAAPVAFARHLPNNMARKIGIQISLILLHLGGGVQTTRNNQVLNNDLLVNRPLTLKDSFVSSIVRSYSCISNYDNNLLNALRAGNDNSVNQVVLKDNIVTINTTTGKEIIYPINSYSKFITLRQQCLKIAIQTFNSADLARLTERVSLDLNFRIGNGGLGPMCDDIRDETVIFKAAAAGAGAGAAVGVAFLDDIYEGIRLAQLVNQEIHNNIDPTAAPPGYADEVEVSRTDFGSFTSNDGKLNGRYHNTLGDLIGYFALIFKNAIVYGKGLLPGAQNEYAKYINNPIFNSAPGFRQAFEEAISLEIYNLLKPIALRILKDFNAATQINITTALETQLFEQNRNLLANIDRDIKNKFSGVINTFFSNNYIPANSPVGQRLARIYSQWETNSNDGSDTVRRFYDSMINVFKLDDTNQWGTSAINKSEYADIANNPHLYRFNLKKPGHNGITGKNGPIFGNTLPMVSTGVYAWVSGDSLSSQTIAQVNHAKSLAAIYMGNTFPSLYGGPPTNAITPMKFDSYGQSTIIPGGVNYTQGINVPVPTGNATLQNILDYIFNALYLDIDDVRSIIYGSVDAVHDYVTSETAKNDIVQKYRQLVSVIPPNSNNNILSIVQRQLEDELTWGNPRANPSGRIISTVYNALPNAGPGAGKAVDGLAARREYKAGLAQLRASLNTLTSRISRPSTNLPHQRILVQDEDFLTDLYMAVYHAGDNDTVAIIDTQSNTGVNVLMDRSLLKNSEFRIDYQKIMKKFNTVSKTNENNSVNNMISAVTDYDELVEEFATGEIYKRDYRGLYKFDSNGQKKYYNENLGDIEKGQKCYTFGIRSNNECKRLMNCLIDGNSKSLGDCLSIYKDANMWRIAEDDVKNVHPTMAVFLLKKFGFKSETHTRNGIQIKVPQDFDTWTNSLPHERRQTIESNPQLTDYLKGIINTLRTNPCILNKNCTDSSISIGSNQPNYLRNSNITQYIVPDGRFDRVSFGYQQLLNRMIQRPPTLGPGQMFYNPAMNVSINYGNTRFGIGQMRGGGAYGGLFGVNNSVTEMITGSNFHKYRFDKLKNELKPLGFTISENDENKINNVIETLGKLENKLGKLYELYVEFIRFSKHMGVRVCPSNSVKNVSVDDIKNPETLERYINSNMYEMQKCLNNTVAYMSNAQNDILNIHTEALRQVSNSRNSEGELEVA